MNDKTAEIRKMYFDPFIRGKGFGNYVVKFILEKAKNIDYTFLTPEKASVLIEVISLYEKYGFLASIGDPH